MKNELLHFFVPEKGRRTKRQPISWLCCWAILLGIVCNACSDDDPVKKNPYLQVSTRALLKEVVEVKFNNIDGNTDITVDFGDGTVKEGKLLPLSLMPIPKVATTHCMLQQVSMRCRRESVSIICWH